VTHDHETDTEDLIERLEDSKGWPNLGKAAAARIRALEAEKKGLALDVLAAQGQAADLEAENSLEAVRQEARAEARQVKPLEWWRSDNGDLCCDTLVGRYQIQQGREKYFMMPAMSHGRRNRPDGDAVPSWHKSEESAKAAAQDDYERRVLSALIPADQEGDQ